PRGLAARRARQWRRQARCLPHRIHRRRRNNLERISLAIWHGLAFVCVTASAESPARFLDARAIDESRFSGESTTDVGCNWKLYIEHCLAEDPGSWAWPALVVSSGADGSVVQQ